jgi:hypothetical protein
VRFLKNELATTITSAFVRTI